MPDETLSAKLKFDGNAAITGMDRAGKAFERMSAGANQAKAGIKNLQQGFAGMKIVAAGLAAATVASVKEFAEFGDAMAAVKAVLGKEAAPTFDALTAKAKELGATTAFTAANAANAMENLARAGLEPKQIMEAIGPVLNAAAAEGMGLASAADIVASNMKAFGLQAKDATRIADALAFVSAKTNTSMIGLQEGLKFVAPVAAQMGIKIEDTAAALGVLADVGLKGSLAGTGLKNALLKISKSAKHGKVALGKYNAEVIINKDNTVNLSKTMLNITAALVKIKNPLKRAQAGMKLLGLRGIGAAGAFGALAKNNDKVKLLFSGMQKRAKGTAKAMADMRLDTLAGDFKLFTSAVSAAGISFGEILRDGIKPFIAQGGGFTKFISDAATGITKLWGAKGEAGIAIAWTDLAMKGMTVSSIKFAQGFVSGIREAAKIFQFFGKVMAVPFNFLKGLFSSPTSVMGAKGPGVQGATKMALQIGAIAIGLKLSISLFSRFGRVAVGTFQLVKGSLTAVKGAVQGTVGFLTSKLPTLARILPRGLGRLAGAVNAAEKITAQPVRVVNFDEMTPLGAGGAGGAAAAAGTLGPAAAGPVSRLGRVAGAAAGLVGVLAAAVAGWQIGKAIDQATGLSSGLAKLAWNMTKDTQAVKQLLLVEKLKTRKRLDDASFASVVGPQGSAQRQVMNFFKLAQKGIKTIEVSGPKGTRKRVALTRAVVEANLRKQFEARQGKAQTDLILQTLEPMLVAIDATLKSTKAIKVEVKLDGRKVGQGTNKSSEDTKNRTNGPGKPGSRRGNRK